MEESIVPQGADLKKWLVENLSSRDKARRARAEEVLESLGPEAFDVVLDILRTEAQKRRKRRRGAAWVFGIYIGVLLIAISAWTAHGLITHHWGHFHFQFFQFFQFSGIIAGAYAVSATQKSGTKFLARYHDPRHIGEFLDTLATMNDKETREIATSALAAALPEMTPELAARLTPEQRVTLRGLLKTNDRALIMAVLAALPVVADTQAIAVLESVLQRTDGKHKLDDEVLTTARQTLSDLEALQELARQKETLLRPAESGEQEHLLRAAASINDTDPATLLRVAPAD